MSEHPQSPEYFPLLTDYANEYVPFEMIQNHELDAFVDEMEYASKAKGGKLVKMYEERFAQDGDAPITIDPAHRETIESVDALSQRINDRYASPEIRNAIANRDEDVLRAFLEEIKAAGRDARSLLSARG